MRSKQLIIIPLVLALILCLTAISVMAQVTPAGTQIRNRLPRRCPTRSLLVCRDAVRIRIWGRSDSPSSFRGSRPARSLRRFLAALLD